MSLINLQIMFGHVLESTCSLTTFIQCNEYSMGNLLTQNVVHSVATFTVTFSVKIISSPVKCNRRSDFRA